jgi:KTSC domain
MKPVAVESTTISTVTYDSDLEILEVELRDRSVYQYLGVPAKAHGAFMSAASKGSYFNRNIRGQFALRSSL